MPTSFSDTTFSSTYKDDFKDSDNYHRILFNSGRALQARELTQLQTITQREMERFGRNIFKEGSVVNPGGFTLDTSYEFIKLQGNPTNVSAGSILEVDGGGITVRVLEFFPEVDPVTEPATAYIEYLDVSTTPGGSNTTRLGGNTLLNVTNGTGQVTTVQQQSGITVSGQGSRVSVNNGSFFIRGHFVQANAQSIILSKYSSTPTANVGFIVTEDIITSDDTDALFDNQNVEPNRTAPGADRYRIRLTLSTEDAVDSDDNFILINRVVDGVIQEEIDKNTYNILGDEMAKRTFEESGNYTVEPFSVKFSQNTSDTSKLNLKVSPGTSYVNGYRNAEETETDISVDKPRSNATELVGSEAISARYGNYLQLDSIEGLPDVSTLEKWTLYDAVGGFGGNPIGTARIRNVSTSGGYYRFHIFDVNMTLGSFRDVRSIGDSADATRYGNLVLEDGVAVVKEVNHNNAFFELPRIRPQNIDVTGLTEQRFAQQPANGSGVLLLPGLTGEGYADASLWILTDSSGSVVTNPDIRDSDVNAKIQGLNANENYSLIYYINRKNLAQERGKDLIQDYTQTGSLTNRELVLDKSDIYQLKEVLDADNNNVTNRFTLDNGQRDNFYDKGRVKLQTGTVTEPITVKYDYFQHDVTGDFFSVNSYIGEVAYENIPKFRQNNGIEVELRNVLDFRSVKDSNGDFDSQLINQLPRNTDTIQADVTYYQSRKDILIATEGGLEYIEGSPNVNPVKPPVPDNGMELFNFTLNPYTDDENDLEKKYIDNRRYTMRDIGGIVERIDNLEETVSLNLLELETSTVEVFDSNGNNRFKNGFFADNFKDLVFSDILNPSYSASLDRGRNIIRPAVNTQSVLFKFDSATSSGITAIGDIALLNYTEQELIYQDIATETENVNPFDVIIYAGDLELAPEIDLWREDIVVGTEELGNSIQTRTSLRLPGRVRRGRNDRISTPILRSIAQSVVFPDLPGSDDLGLPEIGNIIGESRVLSRRTSTVRTNTSIDTITTVRTLVGQRVVGIDLLPFVRSRRVFFRANQLAPNRQHFLFFDGYNMADYVKSENFRTFQEITPPDDFLGGEYTGATSHPNTPTAATSFVTDAFGYIEGSFFIPNNNEIKFDGGNKTVKILDISVDDEDAALSGAAAIYTAGGAQVSLVDVISTTRTRRSRPVPRPRPTPRPPTRRRRRRGKRREPIAQSFQLQNTNGGFITSIDIFLASKSTTVPIRLEVRPVRNGVPSQDEIIPGSVVVKNPSEISNVFSEADVVSNPGSAAIQGIRGKNTRFTFDRPIYLEGFTEYAFVLIANTQDYTVWVAEIEEFIVGTTSQRVTKQPSVGSFFMSQNAITWTPDQRRDMMFRINRANFTSSGSFNLVNDGTSTPPVNLSTDPLLTDSGDSAVTILHSGHGFISGDNINISGFDSNSTYAGISGSILNGIQQISKVDGYGYQFRVSTPANSTIQTGGSGIVSEQNVLMDEMVPTLDVFAVEGTSSTFSGSFSGTLSLAQANNQTSSPYSTPSGRDIQPNQLIRFESPRVIANSRIETQHLATAKSANISGSFSTTDTWVSPVLDLQTASVLAISNVIDNQDSDLGADNIVTNNPIEYISETDPFSGSAMSKHITIPITLEQSAVGLKVLAAVNRPTGSNIQLYYKTVPEGEDLDIDNQSWVYQEAENIIAEDNNREVFRQYEWLIGGPGGSINEFSAFQLKIVMNSSNTSKVPLIQDLRAIALGT